ncbi:hypothetical protein SAY87_027714 [Trapa incisa]|uniref:RING-type domain-containing protein n=1 Tax=Trapa incisa TaxID=236973 RepID=A0AAN7JN77_9MYRT|nr:hypothetical protein SAY87_027714 [Trapa incisa]
MMERGLHGLEPVVVSNFPTKKYGDMFSSVDDTHCIVCLMEYHHEDVLRILPNCGHSFHANCIDIWLHQHSTCPVCRISLREHSEKKRIMQPLFSSAFRTFRGPEQFLVHSPNCVYAGQSYHARTSGQNHAGPIQEDSGGSRSTITEVREIILTMDDEQGQLSRSKKGKHLESPSNGQVKYIPEAAVCASLSLTPANSFLASLNDASVSTFNHVFPVNSDSAFPHCIKINLEAPKFPIRLALYEKACG